MRRLPHPPAGEPRSPGRSSPATLRWAARLLTALAMLAAATLTAVAQARTTRVAAAASMNPALADVARQFERERRMHVELVFGASGTLTRQILEGAPFEVLLAADETFPQRLVDAGLTRGAAIPYAVGRLALFVPTGSPLPLDARLEALAGLLRDGRVTRFAIANPASAPYGRAAEEVLRRYGLWDRLRSHLVMGDSVAQAAQFAVTGDAIGGLLPGSVVGTPELTSRGSSVLIPADQHGALRHGMVLLRRAGPVAAAFFDYVRSPAAARVLRAHGFEAPAS